MTITLRYVDENSDKTYRIELIGNLVRAYYGRTGKSLQHKDYPKPTASEAARFAQVLEQKKRAKGYVDFNATASAVAPSPSAPVPVTWYLAGKKDARAAERVQRVLRIELPADGGWVEPRPGCALRLRRFTNGGMEISMSASPGDLESTALLIAVGAACGTTLVDDEAKPCDTTDWVRDNRAALSADMVETLEEIGVIARQVDFAALAAKMDATTTWSTAF